MGRFRWIDWPDQFDVRCPRCSGRAVFDYPYLFHPTREGTPDPQGLPLHKWRDWWVTERYPSVMPWSPPKGYLPLCANPWEWTTGHTGAHRYHKLGVVKCGRCHLVAAREVVWPDDAYWRWEIRGALLWAWSRHHAESLLEFIQSDQREMPRSAPHGELLRKLPREIISAKSRPTVVKEITASLQREVKW